MKIGDIYDKNGITGILVAISFNGDGIIMSLDETRMPWCEDTAYKRAGKTSWGAYKGIKVGAVDQDGVKNCSLIEKASNWESQFPAFNWCRLKGDDWYIPSIEEWISIFSNVETAEVISKNLASIDAPSLFLKSNWGGKTYWTSSEGTVSGNLEFLGIEQIVYCFNYGQLSISSDLKNSKYCYARAFARI